MTYANDISPRRTPSSSCRQIVVTPTEMRVVIAENGETGFYMEDVAAMLGFTTLDEVLSIVPEQNKEIIEATLRRWSEGSPAFQERGELIWLD